MKRLFDIITVVLSMPLWLPIYAAVAAAIALTDGRPVHFKQKRAGLKTHPFNIVKFRTMRPGDGSDAARTTKLGQILRSSSLDELPQLWLVLAGKMSLVGPRPLPVRYLPRYTPLQARRHELAPGITGWAQVNGRNSISWDEKFKLDIWYVENHSLLVDLKIVFLTIRNVMRKTGVNSSAEQTMPEFTGTECGAPNAERNSHES